MYETEHFVLSRKKICPQNESMKKMRNVNNWESIITTLLSFFCFEYCGMGRKNCTPQNYCSSFMCTCIPCISWLFHFFYENIFRLILTMAQTFLFIFSMQKRPKLHLKTNNFKVVNICQAIMVASPHSTPHHTYNSSSHVFFCLENKSNIPTK